MATMDTPNANSLLKPRLRLVRRSPSPRSQDMDNTPHAGPSSGRLQGFNAGDNEDDDHPTPRMSAVPISLSPTVGSGANHNSSSSRSVITSESAARLRALLRSSPPKSPNRPPPSSVADSDFDPLRFSPTTPSIASKSLRDLMSHVMREPGDTPQKGRPRRNSFDTSEVEITPILDKERAKHKGKRRSLSDEEVDKPKPSRGSDSSFRSSPAATFDTLRARLASSQTQIMDQKQPTALFDPTESLMSSANKTNSELHANADSTFLRQFNSSSATPPAATSTPLRSFQMPSQLAQQSNLLDQDSEMQHAMDSFDISETEEPPPPPPTRAPSAPRPSITPIRPRSSLSLRGHPHEHNPSSRRVSLEMPSSRASSSLSGADFKDHELSREEELNRQREREWNRPKPLRPTTPLTRSGTPELHRRHSQELNRRHSQEAHPWPSPSHIRTLSHESIASRSGSPRMMMNGRGLERRGSSASLRSFDDDRSSRASSRNSGADYRDRISDLDREKNHEREREWNKRQPPPRPTSSLSLHSPTHSRTHSHPPRPPSTTPYLAPTHASLSRQSSHSSLGRPGSPTSSLGSRGSMKEHKDEEVREVVHERERNWNSPQPKWNSTRHNSHGSGGNEGVFSSPSHSYSHSRPLSQSMRGSSSLTSSALEAHDKNPPSMSKPSLHRADTTPTTTTPAQSHKHRPESPTLQSNGHASYGRQDTTSYTPAAASRFGFSFPRSHASLPPLELDSSPERRLNATRQTDSSHRHTRRTSTPSPTPSSRPSSRASGAVKFSMIPVRSTPKTPGSRTNGKGMEGSEGGYVKGHRRRSTEFSESVGRVPPRFNKLDDEEQDDMVFASDVESIAAFPAQSTTPQSDPRALFSEAAEDPEEVEEVQTDAGTEVLVSPPSSPSKQRQSPTQSPSDDEARLRKVLGPSQASPSLRSRTPPPDRPFLQSDVPSPATELSSTPPGSPPRAGTPPSHDAVSQQSPVFALTTPPRRPSFSASILEFRTPSPPHDLPGPPSSSEDEVDTREADRTPVRQNTDLPINPNFTAMKTPRPPGAWAVTPLPARHSSPAPSSPSESTPTLASTSTPLPRAQSHPDSHVKAEVSSEIGLLTPVASLSRANSLPLQTPAPPGAWMATPNQPTSQTGSLGQSQSQFGSIGRRRSILKVRFDVTESEASATEGDRQESLLSAIRTSAPDVSGPTGDEGQREIIPPTTQINGSADIATASSASVPVTRPRTPERPTTPTTFAPAPSPRSLRRSPSIRMVDAYGRERVDDIPLPMEMGNGCVNGNHPLSRDDDQKPTRPTKTEGHIAPPTPRTINKSTVRIVDAMGREIEETAEPPRHEAETSTNGDFSFLSDDTPIGRNEALARMRETLRDLAEGLSDADVSVDDLALNKTHLQELDEVSKAARLARNMLAQNLQLARENEPTMKGRLGSLKESMRRSKYLPSIVTGQRVTPNGIWIWCGILAQVVLFLAMWRYAHVHARRLFHTTYYDPLYPELHPLPDSQPPYSYSHSRSLFDAFEVFRRDGWKALRQEMKRALTQVGDNVWERWGEPLYAGAWPPS
ncbi:hypothetical protein BV22DRAFT_1062786 [Leucogyrophana mollusca]|uniref:Uncharacterized protein n=1 Tax=Leucogyrophana mollusca TaxID=85980 RepID=A0ACB8BL35_9AGAM|nr:hypothetical protein BV22DRAFT_1062786 [Leucogyrophana mollusca]